MSDSPTSPDRGPLTAVLLTLVVLLAVASLVLGGFVIRNRQHRSDLDEARAGALKAGKQVIINLDAISYPTLAADLKRVQDGSTGKFKELFTKSEATLRELYPQQKTSSSGKVVAAAVVSADLSTVRLLVASDRTVRSVETQQKAVTQPSRWALVMEKHRGAWLLADLEPVP